MVMDWYSLRVISGKEKSVETSIMREVDENDISSEIKTKIRTVLKLPVIGSEPAKKKKKRKSGK